MDGIYLLDTNAAIALLAKETELENLIVSADRVFVSSITLGELYFGAEKSKQLEGNRQRVDDFAARNAVLLCDLETARSYGKIRQKLRAKGRPIPENDVWIAAVAMQHGLTLVTRDAHFKNVDDLPLQTW
jgi:tRNA(fMet)-specific endonuclease VapC